MGVGGEGGGRGDPVISQEIKAERDRNRDREMTDLFILNGGSVSPSERHCNLVSSQGEFDLPVEAGCGLFSDPPSLHLYRRDSAVLASLRAARRFPPSFLTHDMDFNHELP